MVEASRRAEGCWESRLRQELRGLSRQLRRAGSGPGEPVGGLGKSRVIKNKLRFSGRACREGQLLPMTADHQQRFGLLGERGRDAFKEMLCRVPGVGRAHRPVHEKARATSVGKKESGLARGVGHDSTSGEWN